METSEAAKEKEPAQIQENITEPTPAEGNFETGILILFWNIKKCMHGHVFVAFYQKITVRLVLY